ncbi:MAG: KpsF/GutQ family sugar-phosphate isomerase [Verrucomicrobia bacterium]|nr:KpsF/GutQ family sugar-phosphate isomerase [Verrucomicrobiota bacterium]
MSASPPDSSRAVTGNPQAQTNLNEALRVFEIEVGALQSLARRLDSTFVDAVAVIKEAVDAGGKVVGLGVGKSGSICHKITATLTSTGTPAISLNTMNALHGDLGILKDGDVVLALSYSGETPELLVLLAHLRRFSIKFISMTGNKQSTLAKHSDIVLDVHVEREACPLSLAPTSSCTAMLVLGDALALALMQAHGFSREDFARFHPGGELGRHLLMTAREMMRPVHQTVFVRCGTTVGEVLDAMIRCKAGAAIVLNAQDSLAGIFTHGDFARAFRTHEGNLTGLPVDSVIITNPIHVFADQLSGEVLHVLKEHRIDELVVIDREKNVPVGIIDSQDLARMKLV